MHSGDTDFYSVESHYSSHGLESAILDALAAAGKDPEQLKPEDLAPIDEFHVRGRKATFELASDVQVDRSMRVLDVGCGLGGASRYLAREFGCRVTGLDQSEDYCRAAAGLTRRLGLDSLVSFQHGDALAMPFSGSAFDIVWTQHAAMNIRDKSRLYREIWRVLRPGGKLAIYDVLAGPGGDAHFPVPWAREPSISFLISSQQLLDILAEIGFEILIWRDVTESGRSWFRNLKKKTAETGSSPLGLQLLLGPVFRRMAHNQFLNLEEGRAGLIEAIARRPLNC